MIALRNLIGNGDVTFTYIKRNSIGFIDSIFDEIKTGGFEILLRDKIFISIEQAEVFYKILADKPFFPSLVNFTGNLHTEAAILYKEGCAVQAYRELIGATNPGAAAEHTLRWKYGNPILYNLGIPANSIHGSGSNEEVLPEIERLLPNLKFT